MELHVIAFEPHSGHLIHIEPSIDAHSWKTREAHFIKKFTAARKYLFKEVFTWLDPRTKIEQIAVLVSHRQSVLNLAQNWHSDRVVTPVL